VNGEQPGTPPRSAEAVRDLAIGRVGWALAPMFFRWMTDARRRRDERWAENAEFERSFQLQMGLARAGDKERFLRQHYGFLARGAGGRP
jgi:hypothetical protein